MGASTNRTAVATFAAACVLGAGNAVGVRFSNRELDPLRGAALRFGAAALVLLVIMASLRLERPRGRALAGAVRKDHDGFNQALAEALELHKAYWSKPERSGDIAGFLALGPLAITCLAYDAGFPIDVESEYLPVRLLDRSWVGEFDT